MGCTECGLTACCVAASACGMATGLDSSKAFSVPSSCTLTASIPYRWMALSAELERERERERESGHLSPRRCNCTYISEYRLSGTLSVGKVMHNKDDHQMMHNLHKHVCVHVLYVHAIIYIYASTSYIP